MNFDPKSDGQTDSNLTFSNWRTDEVNRVSANGNGSVARDHGLTDKAGSVRISELAIAMAQLNSSHSEKWVDERLI